jgi:hypothetical protein
MIRMEPEMYVCIVPGEVDPAEMRRKASLRQEDSWMRTPK